MWLDVGKTTLCFSHIRVVGWREQPLLASVNDARGRTTCVADVGGVTSSYHGQDSAEHDRH